LASLGRKSEQNSITLEKNEKDEVVKNFDHIGMSGDKLHVTQVGDFSNGISQAQCMCAPEFTTHSEGARVGVE